MKHFRLRFFLFFLLFSVFSLQCQATEICNTSDLSTDCGRDLFMLRMFYLNLLTDPGINTAESPYSVSGVSFATVPLPGGMTFPTGNNDANTDEVLLPFELGETEVTYELWYAVYLWATAGSGAAGAGQYVFINQGREGNNGVEGAAPTDNRFHPVVRISWRDAMIWSNALTEFYNAENGTALACVYTTDAVHTNCIRQVASGGLQLDPGQQDNPYINGEAKGFRLPMAAEWEMAARYGASAGTEMPVGSGIYWTPFDYASGATANYLSIAVTEAVAWFDANSDDSTQPVAMAGNPGGEPFSGNANQAGLYDMSGNVAELVFDWSPDQPDVARIHRGGAYSDGAMAMQVHRYTDVNPAGTAFFLGFRLARTP